jgi:hypothetical protein
MVKSILAEPLSYDGGDKGDSTRRWYSKARDTYRVQMLLL